MDKSDHRKGALPFEFVPIPKEVLRSAEYQAMPNSSKALMLDLAAQYTGKNNGRLSPSFLVMKRSGWTAPNTLQRAKQALLDCQFATLTRKGHAPRTAEWIGLSWWKLDYHPSMDIEPRAFPYLNFINARKADPNTGRPTLKTGSDVQNLYRSVLKTPPGCTETVSMGAVQ